MAKNEFYRSPYNLRSGVPAAPGTTSPTFDQDLASSLLDDVSPLTLPGQLVLDQIVQQTNATARQKEYGTKRKLELAAGSPVVPSPVVPSPAVPAQKDEDAGFKFTRTPGRNSKRARRIKTPLQPSTSQNDGENIDGTKSRTPKLRTKPNDASKVSKLSAGVKADSEGSSKLKLPSFKKGTRTKTASAAQ